MVVTGIVVYLTTWNLENIAVLVSAVITSLGAVIGMSMGETIGQKVGKLVGKIFGEDTDVIAMYRSESLWILDGEELHFLMVINIKFSPVDLVLGIQRKAR